VIKRLRGLLTEFGVVPPLSPEKLRRELARCQTRRTRVCRRRCVSSSAIKSSRSISWMHVCEASPMIVHQAQQSEVAQRLQTIAGVDPTTAAAMVAIVGDANDFRNGRQFAAWLGLTPRQHSTGGRTRLGCITKRRDAYLRTLLILGARSTLQSALRKPARNTTRLQQWIVAAFDRIGYHKTLVAIANKHARIMWALLVKSERFDLRRLAQHAV